MIEKKHEPATDRPRLAAGLYFVSTPIGTARDITLRALDILGQADILASEDTRNTRRLLDIHGVALDGRPLVAYHDHNGEKQRPKLLAALADGKSVAYVSDAGTPMVADPGFSLGRAASEAGFMVTASPGPSALLAALTVSGMPTDKFFFGGFLPPKSGARRKQLEGYKSIPGTLVFFENARRLHGMLGDLREVLGEREVCICRELTKKFEETLKMPLDAMIEHLDKAGPPKGECVVLIGAGQGAEAVDISALLQDALKTLSVKDAVKHVTDISGQPRKAVYELALSLKGGADG